MPIDARGRLDDEPFSHRSTKDGRVLVAFHGRHVTTVSGRRAQRLRSDLERTAGDVAQIQLLLAKVTGHFKHGNER
jgi:hypothetical protein